MAGGAGNPLPLDSVLRWQPLKLDTHAFYICILQRCLFVSCRYDANGDVIELGRLATGRMNHGSVFATHLKRTSHLMIRSPLIHTPHVWDQVLSVFMGRFNFFHCCWRSWWSHEVGLHRGSIKIHLLLQFEPNQWLRCWISMMEPGSVEGIWTSEDKG